jgi:hypothetical protein
MVLTFTKSCRTIFHKNHIDKDQQGNDRRHNNTQSRRQYSMSVVDKRTNFLVVKNEHAERWTWTWTWRLNQK